jgi:hypothetical protein
LQLGSSFRFFVLPIYITMLRAYRTFIPFKLPFPTASETHKRLNMASAGQNLPPPPNPPTPGPKHKNSSIAASSPTSTEWLDFEDSPSSIENDHGDIREDLAVINGRLDALQIRLDSIEPRIPSAEQQQKRSKLLVNIDERVQRIPEIEKHLQKLLDSNVALELHFIKSEQQQDQVQHLGRMNTRLQTTVNTTQPTNARFERLENLMTAVMEIIRRTAPVPSLPPSHLTASVDRRASNIGRANTGGGKQMGSFGNHGSGRGINRNDANWSRDNTGGGANMGGGAVVHWEGNTTGINPPQPFTPPTCHSSASRKSGGTDKKGYWTDKSSWRGS